MATTQSGSEVTEFPLPARLMSISVHAGEVFANQEKAIHWLRSPNPSLEGKTPLEAAQTGRGYREVEDVLVRIEHGVLG
jgi:putative toxin-antitoxin system antitoxin component (TIGR02293 family)